jgi:hypothetical protein
MSLPSAWPSSLFQEWLLAVRLWLDSISDQSDVSYVSLSTLRELSGWARNACGHLDTLYPQLGKKASVLIMVLWRKVPGTWARRKAKWYQGMGCATIIQVQPSTIKMLPQI